MEQFVKLMYNKTEYLELLKKEILKGIGMSVKEYAKIGIAFEKLPNSTAVKKIIKD